MCRVICGSSSDPLGQSSFCRNLPKGKIALVALSVLMIGLGLAVYFYGPQILPQVFSTTTCQIAGAAVLGGVGVFIDVALIIQYCCNRYKERTDSLSRRPTPVHVRPPVKLTVHYGREDGGSRFLLTMGGQAYDQLKCGERVRQPAVVLTRTDDKVHI